ncbi:cobalt-precorrin 4 C11-methyltransferase [Geoalkalibacter ferrihydriticus]|uniref:Cobalt-precorrin-4 C(11)-methyltransferase n=2 Tax=Geoalkalibacter ferrihydriticus TaxID=392333 RepID=A0A0C2ECM4_9BACT|nr:precorrin-4 C(11)-methyltransferase [Geoalkalibacter ferrihydriticus]KIH76338.1 cobalt-precorrin-4 C(11)-methyltransferase [Geoalkalibacter ferrihydriticus DSM 17813]SDL19788.1 cobalt-precorrin 4 C11-methyltransferase [Geoalkalibacter ferrihydriticus]
MSTVLFVGAGPGDPELITVKGLKALRQADLVVYAGSLVNRALLAELKPGARAVDSAPLALEEIVACMAEALAAGRQVVRLHTGDPCIYGAIQEQIAALAEHGIAAQVIPGVTAAFAAAAGLGQELTLPEVSQTVIISRREGRTPVPEREKLEKIAALGATLCLYLSVGMMEEVVADLLAGGAYAPSTPVAVVSKASWADEQRIEGTLGDITEKVRQAGISRQAVILVGEVLNARHQGVGEKSKLYDRNFVHGFRT